jgi:hypothetical protein
MSRTYKDIRKEYRSQRGRQIAELERARAARRGELAMADLSCPHAEAALRFDDMREVEICASCGIEIDGVTADRAMEGDWL